MENLKFKIRASRAGDIMGIKGLGKTGEIYCENWLNEKTTGRKKIIKSKYIEKGNLTEEDGFTLMSLQLNLGMVYKNNKYFEDDFMCGTPDLVLDKIYDNKSSWDIYTFPRWKKEIPDLNYWWQMQVYMHLTGIKEAVLVYTLLNAPDDLINQSIKYEINEQKKKDIVRNMVFTKDAWVKYYPDDNDFIEISEKDRVKSFTIQYDLESIKKLQNRVLECREYINQLLKQIK